MCNPDCSARLRAEWPDRAELQAEAAWLQARLETATCPVVFCHNDALLDNIVLQHNNNSVAFIDLEYGAPNYNAFDIANHFCEFAGSICPLDFPKSLPSKEYQLAWIGEYLLHRNNETPAPAEVESLYLTVTRFMLCAHLQWSVWAVIQAENSTLDFDFVDYAIQRHAEYKRWKRILIQRQIITS